MSQEPAGKLIPILREGIEIAKMVVFKTSKARREELHPAEDEIFRSRLGAALLNGIFEEARAAEGKGAAFSLAHGELVAAEIAALATMEDMRILLTDALRMQVLCDLQEGRDSRRLLEQARDQGLLLPERDLPLPHTFLQLVRRLGVAHGILLPLEARQPSAAPPP